MNKYYVKMKIDFSGEIMADSQKEAEDKAWTAWSDTADSELQYDGIYSIDIDDLGKVCEECDDVDCDCEDEEVVA